jgi:hypothetical protein
MSAVSELSYPATEGQDIQSYRAVSRAAIVSVVLGVISLLAIVFATLLVLPLIGLILGLVAFSTVRRYPAEYTGGNLAVAGILLCAGVLVGGTARHTYIYMTEVPPNHRRTGFWELQPDPDYPEYGPVSKTALDLSGKKIFIKGYMHPGVASLGKVDHFILVPDMGTCCFGGDPKSTDMIEVKVPDAGNRLAYKRRQIKLAGEFAVTPPVSASLKMKNPVWYHLEVHEVR